MHTRQHSCIMRHCRSNKSPTRGCEKVKKKTQARRWQHRPTTNEATQKCISHQKKKKNEGKTRLSIILRRHLDYIVSIPAPPNLPSLLALSLPPLNISITFNSHPKYIRSTLDRYHGPPVHPPRTTRLRFYNQHRWKR